MEMNELIDERTLDKIRKIARKRGISESQVISEAVKSLAASLYFDEVTDGQNIVEQMTPSQFVINQSRNYIDGKKAVALNKKILDEIIETESIASSSGTELMPGGFKLDEVLNNSLSSDVIALSSFKDNLDVEAKGATPQTHRDRSNMTRGLINMMHNKIFPAVFLTYSLDFCLKANEKTWISLDSFKDFAYRNAQIFLNILPEGSPNSDLKKGFQATENRLKRKLKPSWSKSRKAEELDIARKESKSRFLSNFVGYYRDSVNLYAGVFGEWELAELKVEKDGKEWIRLGRNGREAAKKFKNLGRHDFQTVKFDFTPAQVGWFLDNILGSFPLEEKAVRMMLAEGRFGTEGMRGTEVLTEKFYELQKAYLKKEAPGETEFIESLRGKMVKDKKTEQEKYNYVIPKNRAISTMSKLQELGLFSSWNGIYEITGPGKEVLELWKSRQLN
jgi:hypothetical protein